MRLVSPSGGRIKEGGMEFKKSIKNYIFNLFLPDIYFTDAPRGSSYRVPTSFMLLCICAQCLPLEGELKREEWNSKKSNKNVIFNLFLPDIYFTDAPCSPSCRVPILKAGS